MITYKDAFKITKKDEEIILVKSLVKDHQDIFESCLNRFKLNSADIDSISKAIHRNLERYIEFKIQIKKYRKFKPYIKDELSSIEKTLSLIYKELSNSTNRLGFNQNTINTILILKEYTQPKSFAGKLKAIENPINYTYFELMEMLECKFSRERFVDECSKHKIKCKDSRGIKETFKMKIMSIDTSQYTIDEIITLTEHKGTRKRMVKILNFYKLPYKHIEFSPPCEEYLKANANKLKNLTLYEIKELSNYPNNLDWLGAYLRREGIEYKSQPYSYITNILREKIHKIDDPSKYTVKEIFKMLDIKAIASGNYLERLNIPFKRTR